MREKRIYLYVSAWRLVSGEGKRRRDGKSKRKEALKIKREGEFDTRVGVSNRVSRNEGNFTLRKEG